MTDLPVETNDTWLDFLGLQVDPFAADHDARFFYAEPAFMQRLDLLTHLAQFSDSLLVVLGDAEAGKTTLAQQFCNHASDNWRLCVLRGEEIDSFDALLLRLANCFNLVTRQEAPDFPDRLIHHCTELREVMELPVLIIDDAQLVAPSVLRALAGLAGDPRQTVQSLRILLFGEPALEGLLAEAGLAPGLAPFVQTLTMPRFNEVQAAAYLMFRLTVAGYSGESPFSVTEVRAIAKSADGRPGRMNSLAREALMEQADRSKVVPAGREDRGAGIRRLLVAAVAGVLIATGWFWLRGPGEEAPPRLEQPEGIAEVPLELPPLPRVGTIEPRLPESEPMAAPMPSVPAVAAEQEPNIPDEASGETAAPPPPIAAAPAMPTAAVEAGEAVQSPPVSAAEKPQEEAPAAEVPTPAAPAAQAAVAESPAGVAPESAAPAAGPTSPPPVPAAPPAKPVAAPLHREDWIRFQDSSRYTLQLLGSRSEDSVRAYIREHGLTGDLAYFHRILKGGDWYTLLYGSFADRPAALAALSRLPMAVQRDKPWLRSFASVQAQLPSP